MTLLLVESDPQEARRLLRIIDEAGHSASRTGTLEEALEVLAGGGVQVVLLDLALPGVDALSRIRAAANDTAIVVLCDVDDPAIAEEAAHAGAHDFLFKRHANALLVDRVVRHAVVRKKLEDRLARARRMEILGELATGIAHEFNNQLTAILGFAELGAWDVEPGHPVRLHLEQVRKAAERSSFLTSNLLAFGSSDGFRPRVIDFGELIEPIGKILGRILGEDIQLRFKSLDAPAPVEVDPVQMQQIVLRLAQRARAAMPNGGLLSIESDVVDGAAACHPGLAAGAHLMLTVRDQGADLDDLPRPSELVEELTRRNGGRIRMEIEPGSGTTTRIYLPLFEVSSVPPDRLVSSRGEETVLVVEDDDSVRELVRRVLEECGYSVLDAAHAESALDVCQKQPRIDLLLTDLVLPGRGGVELATLAKRDLPRLKVLFTTGYGARAQVPAGAALLPKPITPASLAREVRRVLDG